MHDLHGKYSFSNDVIFNENTSSRLGVPCSLSPPPAAPDALVPRPVRDRSRVRTTRGSAYDEVLCLKEFRRNERERQRSFLVSDVDGGAPSHAGSALAVVDHSFSLDVLDSFFSLIASSLLPDLVNTFSLSSAESTVVWDHLLFPSTFSDPSALDTVALRAVAPSSSSVSCSFDLNMVPSSYSEAIARPDTSIW